MTQLIRSHLVRSIPCSHIIKRRQKADDSADQGQGAGQAIEDAATLSIVLPKGTPPEEVQERLNLYEKIRYKRAHTIQEYSRQAGKDWIDGKPQVDSKPGCPRSPLCFPFLPPDQSANNFSSGLLYGV